jgi:PAS domain S-box-containing protein
VSDPGSEQRATEKALERARRMLHVLTRCNEAILRASSEEALFADVCAVLVQSGGYRMCWVGVAEQDQRGTIRPVAHAGHEDGYLGIVDLVWSDSLRGRGPTGRAVREGRVVVGHDFASDEALAPWREEALRRGYRSSTALPIGFDGENVGVLTMYSGEVETFREEELRFLGQLADDLGYGAVTLRRGAEKARVERDLRGSEASLRQIFDLNPDAAIVNRLRDGKYLAVNQGFLEMTGWTREEVLGRSPIDLGIWEEPAQRDRMVARLEEQGFVQNLEARFRTRSGKVVEALLSARVVTFAGERAILSITRDITEWKRNEQRYRLLANNSLDVIWTMDLSTMRLNYVSPAIERLRGVTVEEALAEPFEETLTPESLARVSEVMARSVGPDGGSSHTGIFDMYCADGSIKHVEITASYVRNEAGRPVEILGVSRDATARVEAERALEQRERELRAILQTALDGFGSVDATGRFLEVNEALCSITGYSRTELLGMPVTVLEQIESDGDIAARMARFRTGAPDRFETRYRRKDGSIIDVEVSVGFSDIEGERFHAFFRDITDRRLAEAALRESERRLATIVRVAQVGVLVTRESDRRIVDANQAWCELVGWRREEVLGRTTAELEVFLDDRDPGRLHDAIGPDEVSPPMEIGIHRRSGEMADVLINAGLAEIGGQRCAISAWQDLTPLHRADDALRESEARFRTLIERSTDIIVLLDGEGRVTFWSSSATEALGWRPEEVQGKKLLDLAHRDDVEQAAGTVRRLLAEGGATANLALRIQHKAGGWRSIDGPGRNLLADPAVRALVLNTRDVTSQLRLEEQYRQAQKLESIGRLAGGVAHDFNNLLTVILSSSEVMKQDRAAGLPVDDEDIDQIHEAGERARDLTRQLLAFARKQVIAPVSLDLNAVVRSSEKLLHRVLGEDIRLVVQAEPGLWPVLCDAGQIEQVLVNLTVNARDAMPGGGALTLETRNLVVDEDDSARDPDRHPGSWVRLIVRDTGVGMSPEAMAHLFEPFFTTKERGKGTGLGLATVHGIVAQSGGHIHVQSQPGLGTTFGICLPRTELPRVPVVAEPPVLSVCGHETILVVEDDPQVRGVTVRALSSNGYDVVPAASGEEALELAARAGDRIDLVVTDVVMPGMTGREVVDQLRRRLPGLRALFVSGYTQDAIAQRGVIDSGVEFLPKPFTPATLVARVRAMLDSR